MVRVTRPVRRASSNGVFLHFDLSSAGSSTQGASRSSTITSAGLPGRSVPPASPRILAGGVARRPLGGGRARQLAERGEPQAGRQHGLEADGAVRRLGEGEALAFHV